MDWVADLAMQSKKYPEHTNCVSMRYWRCSNMARFSFNVALMRQHLSGQVQCHHATQHWSRTRLHGHRSEIRWTRAMVVQRTAMCGMAVQLRSFNTKQALRFSRQHRMPQHDTLSHAYVICNSSVGKSYALFANSSAISSIAAGHHTVSACRWYRQGCGRGTHPRGVSLDSIWDP